MKIIWNEKSYEVITEDSGTSRAVEKLLPVRLKMRRNHDVEFVGELPKKPVNDGRKVSVIRPDEVYYYEGWNVLCLNYAHGDISPYEVTYLGRIEGSCSDELKNAPDHIEIRYYVLRV